MIEHSSQAQHGLKFYIDIAFLRLVYHPCNRITI